MKHSNCYSIIMKEEKILYRRGIPCEVLQNRNKVLLILNGLGSYRLFQKPVDIETSCTTDEEIALKFSDYPCSDPWIGLENDGSYFLYGANINKEYLYLQSPLLDKPELEYVLVRVPKKYEVRLLGDGRIIFRRFDDNDIVAMLEIRGPSMIDIESDKGLIMVEPLGKGKFVCR